MLKNPPRYHSYLLRFWKETDWRFMLENPHNGERRGFSSCEELVAFIEAELAGEQELAREELET